MNALELTTVLEPRGPAAAIVLSDEQVAAFDAGRAFPVTVTIDGRTARLRLARMGGENLVGLSRAARADLGVEIGQDVTVVIALDEAPREVEVPAELAAVLDGDAGLRSAWDALAFSHRREHARAVAEAKRPETRQRRVDAVVEALRRR
ncbi:MAG: 2-isopropylmalate synthase [Micrococcales bacterium 73-15]|uniref:YdeI/OmpD-associated family protein n=1 Tax=Salana multivorans TaxID=120377 RepID=UPI000965FAB4|nr:YdeI/OmpD-associated family protein [Salana multivorans]OJX94708.1 MAG: 2-isopropylmalate synthase [Micrococcales bacterium 73-15]